MFLAAAALLLALPAPSLFAWGEDGHRIVCEIAFLSLSPPERQKVRQLTAGYEVPDGAEDIRFYTDGCVFPDVARPNARQAAKDGDEDSPWFRFNEFNRWHFFNITRDTKKLDQGDCGGNCVVDAIDEHARRLKNAANDQERAEALFFLGHWVGDIHQPLHISYEDDEGGNQTPVEKGFYRIPRQNRPPILIDKLHSVWDTGIIIKAVGRLGWRAYAGRLHRTITDEERAAWLDSEPIDWAQESYELTTMNEVDYCRMENGQCAREPHVRVLGRSYQREFEDDVELRLKKAGVRLAQRIKDNL
jgi:hypothetical protein